MYRELLPQEIDEFDDSNRIHARLNQALSLRAFSLSKYTEHKKGNRTYYTSDDDLTNEAIKRLNRIIKGFYKVKQSDRNLICHQIAKILVESPPPNVIKIDLKSFYHNVNCELILSKLTKDRIFCPYTFSLLKQAILPEENSHHSGIPEGICISATLAELYLREIDQAISQIEGCLYYSRFVDDILIFTISDPILVRQTVYSLLEPTAHINKSKEYLYSSRSHPVVRFDYLGYNFRASNKNANVSIEIADKKIKRLKTKIILSIIQFGKDKQISELYERIQYLTGNSIILSTNRDKPIKTGTYFTYNLATRKEISRQLQKIDNFLYKIFSARRGRIASCLSTLSRKQRRAIVKNNFTAGFQNRKVREYQLVEIENITRPWKYA